MVLSLYLSKRNLNFSARMVLSLYLSQKEFEFLCKDGSFPLFVTKGIYISLQGWFFPSICHRRNLNFSARMVLSLYLSQNEFKFLCKDGSFPLFVTEGI
jgi:hypothetical protein